MRISTIASHAAAAWQAMISRSCGRFIITEMKPLPSGPSRFSLGTWTSVKLSSAGVLGVQPDLVEVAAWPEALHAALDDEQADAVVTGLGAGR